MKRCVGVLLAAVLSAPGVAVVMAHPAVATDLPTITIGDSSVYEGDAGSATVSVPVDLSAPSATTVKVKYSITSDSATGGSDFGTRNGSISFSKGAASKVITVQVYGDTDAEQDEHINITLSSPVGATLAKADGGVTIIDDDADGTGSGVEVNIGDVTVVEANAGRHVATIPVTLSVPAPSKIKVVYTLQCGSAAEGSDYSEKPTGTLTFSQGQQSKSISFDVVADMSPEQIAKSLVNKISVAFGPALVHEVSGDGTIIDNDATSSNPPPLQTGDIRRVSVATDGTEAQPLASYCGGAYRWGSLHEAISANGRYVAFVSDAPNLVPGDGNFDIDVFVHDLVTGTTERVSVQNDGSEFPSQYSINAWQTALDNPGISADGRYVSFKNNYDGQTYLRDRVAGTTEMISVTPTGQKSNADCCMQDLSSVSADGRYVAFTSLATDIMSTPTPARHMALYLRDRQLGVTRLVDVYPQFTPGDFSTWGGPSISADGSSIVFNDPDENLVSGDNNGCVDTFVYDVASGTSERVSVTSSGDQQLRIGNTSCSSSTRPVISGNGRYVGFTSTSYNLYGLAAGDPAAPTVTVHAYVHDRQTGTTTLIDDATVHGSDSWAYLVGLSDDGNDVAFICSCGDPIAGPPADVPDFVTIYADRAAGTMTEVGVQADGTPPIDEDTGYLTFTYAWGGMSADGSVITFDSHATNLVPGDSNGVFDVFVQKMA